MHTLAQIIAYDTALWIFNLMIDIFFREVRPRGAHKIPKKGPVIFVVAPHANQVMYIYSETKPIKKHNDRFKLIQSLHIYVVC